MYKHFFKALEVHEQTGSLDQVFEHVCKIEDESERESTLAKLSKHFARTGQPDVSRRFSAAICRKENRIHTLQEVAQVLRTKGQIEAGRAFLQQAFEEAASFKGSRSTTANLFLCLSAAFHEYGRTEEAQALLNTAVKLGGAGSGVGDSKFLFECSMQLKNWNRAEDARLLAETIKHEWFRKHALDELRKEQN